MEPGNGTCDASRAREEETIGTEETEIKALAPTVHLAPDTSRHHTTAEAEGCAETLAAPHV